MQGFGLVAQAVSQSEKFLVSSLNSGYGHIASAGISELWTRTHEHNTFRFQYQPIHREN
jgi:hypothetical protein